MRRCPARSSAGWLPRPRSAWAGGAIGDHAAGLPGSAIERSGGVQREYVPLLIIGADVPSRSDERLASFLDIGRSLRGSMCASPPDFALKNSSTTVSGSARLHCRRLEEIRDYRFRTLIVNALVASWALSLSLTRTVKLVEPGFVGFPLITPVLLLLDNDKPG